MSVRGKMIHLKFRKSVFALIVLIFVIAVFLAIKNYLSINCDVAIIINKSFSEIPKEMLTSQTIFFLETHNSTDHFLSVRAACSIESAGKFRVN